MTQVAPFCHAAPPLAGASSDEALLDEISRAAFLFFTREADPGSGLVPDKTGARVCSAASMATFWKLPW